MSGACCNEMDIWEANSLATAVTPHTCSKPGSFACSGAECGRTEAVCDKSGTCLGDLAAGKFHEVRANNNNYISGCGNNPFGLGARDFYGPGLTVDTSRRFTVITQFRTAGNTANSSLSEIRRMYIQDGKLIDNAMVTNISGRSVQMPGTVTQEFCTARNASSYLQLGGMEGMGRSLARGMVLIFSLWNSDDDFMNCE